jgi:hypothetical protein
MKSLRTILAAILALTLPAAGQTIKSLGYNTTNGQIVYSGTNPLTFTNAPAFSQAAAVRTNLGLGATNSVTFNTLQTTSLGTFASPAVRIGTNATGLTAFNGFLWLVHNGVAAINIDSTNVAISGAASFGDASTTRDNLSLGATNSVTFSNLAVGGAITTANSSAAPATNSTLARGIQWPLIGGSLHGAIYGGYDGAARISIALGTSNSLSDVATFRSSGMTIASNAIVNGTLTASNLTVSGTLTAASIATSTPVSWSLDAVQTAAATNGVLDLPLNANVLRITNANAISAITNGRLGAFYYIVNQSGTNLVLSNSSTITTRGGGTVTLAPNQSATLLSTSATNATLQGGPSQLDSPTFAGLTATGNVTMSGTANTAPNQTAASGASIMTRDLVDQRETDRMISAPRMVWLTTFTGWSTAVSNGTVSQNVFLRASSGTNQWDYAVARNFQPMELFFGEGDQLNFSKKGGMGIAYFSAGANFRDGTTILYLGAASTYVPSTGSAVSNPATKGIGWRIKDESIVATMYATNYVEVATNSTTLSTNATTRENFWLYIDWDGVGGVSWYVNGNEIASTTNGPTGLTSVNQGYFVLGSVADIPLTTANQPSITAIVLDREP